MAGWEAHQAERQREGSQSKQRKLALGKHHGEAQIISKMLGFSLLLSSISLGAIFIHHSQGIFFSSLSQVPENNKKILLPIVPLLTPIYV